MICAGETSGELYGAMLSRELKRRWHDIEIFGIGGRKMEAEGAALIAPMSHVLGIAEAVQHLREIRQTFRRAKEALSNKKPDVLVLIDYPDFNIALARKAKAAGIPVLYYVSPQVWAWRSGRVKTIASLVNRMAVLFPFEVDCYQQTGLPCEFVGHPLAENIPIAESKEELKRNLGLDPERQVLSLLPGSRPNELKKHGHIIGDVAAKIKKHFPDMQIVMPLAPGSEFPSPLPAYVKPLHGLTKEALACSEAAAVASGTATLETALMGVPMVVFYRVSPVTYFLAKLLAKVPFISLANILSGKEVVKELLQENANADMVFSELNKILTDDMYRGAMIADLQKIQQVMQGKKPSARVAALVGELAGWTAPHELRAAER